MCGCNLNRFWQQPTQSARRGHGLLARRVTAIRVDQATKKVYVSLQADASSLFPSILRGVVVNGEGEAEARLGSR